MTLAPSRPRRWVAALALLALATTSLSAQRGRRSRPAGWIQDDLSRAIATAKRTQKPLLVVFRCPP